MVIHDDTSIPEKTKKRIWKIIKNLGYVPNYAARSLAGGKTGNIALVASYFHHHFYQEILRGIDMANRGSGCSLLFFASQENIGVEEDIFRKILYGNIADGMITLNRHPGYKMLKEFRKRNFPVLMIEHSHRFAHTICCNNYRGACIAAEHLLKTGRQKPMIVSGMDFWGPLVEERIAGYKMALLDHGLDFRNDRVIRVMQASFTSGEDAFKKITSAGIKFDAFFCAAGDAVAIGMMKQARNQGMKIPDDFTIIGYDDIEIATYVDPALTTIRQPGVMMGKKALEIILNLLEKPDPAELENIIFEPELVVRESG